MTRHISIDSRSAKGLNFVHMVTLGILITVIMACLPTVVQAQRGQQRFLDTRVQQVKEPGYATGPTVEGIKRETELANLKVTRIQKERELDHWVRQYLGKTKRGRLDHGPGIDTSKPDIATIQTRMRDLSQEIKDLDKKIQALEHGPAR